VARIVAAEKRPWTRSLRYSLPEELTPLYSPGQISIRLDELAGDIARNVPANERPIAIVVLQGAFVFAADLLRRLPPRYPIDVAFLRCESYGTAAHSSGRVLLLQDLDATIDLKGRTVLLIDDILDTGLTMRFLVEHLKQRGATAVRICVLMHRKRLRKAALNGAARKRLKPDYFAFNIGQEFIVGYGLDHNGKYRHLASLAALKLPSPQRRKI
jgi:hypoxanthine phosphoribosyltransferase